MRCLVGDVVCLHYLSELYECEGVRRTTLRHDLLSIYVDFCSHEFLAFIHQAPIAKNRTQPRSGMMCFRDDYQEDIRKSFLHTIFTHRNAVRINKRIIPARKDIYPTNCDTSAI